MCQHVSAPDQPGESLMSVKLCRDNHSDRALPGGQPAFQQPFGGDSVMIIPVSHVREMHPSSQSGNAVRTGHMPLCLTVALDGGNQHGALELGPELANRGSSCVYDPLCQAS